MLDFAKLSRPRLAAVYPRERLFARLDQCRRHAAIWIAGAPGAGKTTLAASYLAARELPALWYQLDAGDADPASFFYYLGLGAHQAGFAGETDLPLLTMEYLPDLPGFTRRFFRALLGRLPNGAVLVLDNYHDVPPDSPLPGLLAAAVKEVREGTNLVLLSRAEPPAHFAGLAASGALAQLAPEELLLTAVETASVAALDGPLDEALAPALHERTQGWAAGVVLLAKRCRRLGADGLHLNGHEATFDYFETEIVARADPPTRELMLRCAWMPRFTATMAEQLSGNAAAGELLAALHRQHCFTSRSSGKVPAYAYHALFRAFLIHRADTCFSDAQRDRIKHRAAQLLAANGQEDDAFQLYCEAGDPAAAVQLILTRAATLVAQGRWQLLEHWLQALPAGMSDATPWLMYWRGVCQAQIQPREARAVLERAYQGFVRMADIQGQLLAASTVVESYFFDVIGYAPLDNWIAVLQTALDGKPTFSSPDIELRVMTGTAFALLFRDLRHPLMEVCLARIRALLANELSLDRKVAAATVLLNHFAFLEEIEEGQAIIALVGRYGDDPRVRPITRMWWWTWVAHFWVRTGSLERTLADLDRAAAIADEHGLTFAAPFVQLCRVDTYLTFGEPAKAESALHKTEPVLDRMSVGDIGYHGFLQCKLALSGMGPPLAPGRARELLSLSLEYGAAAVNNLGLICHAVILARHGDHQAALECAQRAAALPPPGSIYATHDAQLIEAYLALLRGDETQARAALAAGMKVGSERGYVNSMRWQPGMMAALCAFALEEQIEVDHARRLIRTLNLKPESADIELWPWPVRIHTLGRFGVLLDGAPLAGTRKAPKKILTLLKALIALGGREVPDQLLADALWPDEAGDTARASLATAVHRLRKLLGSAETVQLHEGRLSLDASRTWVDSWAFERLSGAEPGSRRAARAIALYHGSFLAGDSECSWTLKPRERLRAKFIRLLAQEAQRLEQAGQPQAAATLYARGIETDALAEAFYQGLMRCYRQQERHAEALAVYRRLRQALSVTLGIAPSPSSDALYRELLIVAG